MVFGLNNPYFLSVYIDVDRTAHFWLLLLLLQFLFVVPLELYILLYIYKNIKPLNTHGMAGTII